MSMLVMSGLSKVYRTEFLETFALRDFSINVKEGEFVAITGPSGSGKTTFLNVAGILEQFTSGEYLLDGVNVREMSDDQRSRLRNEKIGFIFQAFNLILDLSVFANVELPLHYRRITAAQRKARVADALRRVGLSARTKHYPGELSGGQQQRVAIARALGEDGVFTTDIGGSEETLLLLKRDFLLQGVVHELYVIRPVTREMARTEVATWKKVIRVVTHELNNTLAPISSLTFTGAELARAGAIERMGEIFAGIRDRTEHLQRFVQGYASFARLPTPRKEYVEWEPFLEGLALHERVRQVGTLPSIRGYFDPGQIEQVLINLIKNATESGGAPEAVEMEIRTTAAAFNIDVRDRGSGMNDAVLANAFLPFYSTKRSGTGLGLAVAREIVDAHAGRLMLSNRAGGGLTVTVLLPIGREAAQAMR
jgi:ABC-type lipoprotein export system ATPase subunit